MICSSTTVLLCAKYNAEVLQLRSCPDNELVFQKALHVTYHDSHGKAQDNSNFCKRDVIVPLGRNPLFDTMELI